MHTAAEKFHGLDHLRALAITMVLIYHYRMFAHPEWVDTYGRFGWMGVDLFFVLSGFLISRQLFHEVNSNGKIGLKAFFTKRFFRIVPPYVVTLSLYFLFPFFRERESLPTIWKFITFTQNIELDLFNFGTFSHAWSLCIEEQFYLLFPLTLALFLYYKKFRIFNYFLVLLFLFSIILREISWQIFVVPNINSDDFWRIWYMKIYYPTYTRLDGLLSGIAIAYFYENALWFKKFINSNGNYLCLVGIALLGFSMWICNDQTSHLASVFGFTAVSISFGLIVMSAVSESSFLYRFKSNWTAQLATLSYAVYLSHKGIIHIMQSFIEETSLEKESNLTFLISMITCLITGLIFRYIIENPSAKIKNYILNRNH
ncbi:acyltransferase [Flavobacterium sp. H4147]|uniref:acyltransferase family protein n=1 Tax=Flavobacterium sp. H4147 TaxID=3034149 RepID=UPI0023ECC764|nr:acyltransferase [Flavobacterium sp. H4147]